MVKTENGPVQLIINGEKSVFFIPQEEMLQCQTLVRSLHINAEIKAVPLTSFDGIELAACYCQTIKQAQQLSQELKQKDILVLEDDIRLADRYLMERFIQGGLEFSGIPEQKRGFTKFHHTQCRKYDYTPQLKVVSLDIECSEKGILYSVRTR